MICSRRHSRITIEPGGAMLPHGFAPYHLLLFIALWNFKCLSGACPALPAARPSPNVVVVSTETALLAAISNQTVTNIMLTNEVVLGPSWASISQPIGILRNLTISSSSLKLQIIDLGSVKHALYLGPGVLLELKNLLVLQDAPKVLDPGLQLLAGATGKAMLLLTNTEISELCCFPSQLWDRFAQDRKLTFASYSSDTTYVCNKNHECYDQQVTFGDLCGSSSIVNASNSSNTTDSFVPYWIRWSQVIMLCEFSTSEECMLENSSSSCFDQCYANVSNRWTIPPPFPPTRPPMSSPPPSPTSTRSTAPPPEEEPQGDGGGASDSVTTIILATVIPLVALVVATAVGLFVLSRRRAREHGPPGSSPDGQKGGFGGFFRNTALEDLEATGPGKKLVSARASTKSGSLTDLGAASGNDKDQQQLAGATMAAPALASARASADMACDAPHGLPQHVVIDLIPGSSSPNHLMAGLEDVQAPSAHSQPQLFNAAQAVASIAASREERDMMGDLMGLQRRVQQLAEQRLISEDEKLVLGKPIGRGAFGMVFHGLWRNLDVAVKTMLFSENDGGRQESALIEAALASSVVHPNVVSVYHFDMKPITVNPSNEGNPESLQVEYKDGQTDWKMYIVQELCQSSLAETLETWVFHDQQTGNPRMDLILSVLLDVACGCAHIHSKNIIWGDLKPGNVLLKMDPNKPHGVIAKITDFGMSTTIDPSLSHISNYNKGTPFYVAPEILMSHQASKTSDVFSFGILIQQMLTRSTPYLCTPSGAIEVNKQFWRPTAGSCAAVTDLRRRCLDQNPKNRPNFDEIFQTLQATYDLILGHFPHPTASPSLVSRSAGAEQLTTGASSGSGHSQADPSLASAEQQQEQLREQRASIGGPPASSMSAAKHGVKGVLEARSVPGRSASSAINEVTSQLTDLQSRLFTNWPMSDGALQGMQLLDSRLAQNAEWQPRPALAIVELSPDGSPRAAHGSSNSACLPCPDPPPAGKSVQQDVFPHWSTHF